MQMLLRTIKKTYGNGFTEKYTTSAYYCSPNRTQKKERARKAKKRAQDRCLSETNYHYFGTLTVKGNSPLRYNGKALLKAGNDFLKSWDLDCYEIVLEAYDINRVECYHSPYFDASNDCGKGFHLHFISSSYVDLSEWVNMYDGYMDNQYCDRFYSDDIIGLSKVCRYMHKAIAQTKAKLPIGTRVYMSNVKVRKSHTEVTVYDDDVHSDKVLDAIFSAKRGMTSKGKKVSVYKGLRVRKRQMRPFIVYVYNEGVIFCYKNKNHDAGRYRQAVHAPPPRGRPKARAPGKEKRRQDTKDAENLIVSGS